jgi:hypothetical protein
MLALKEREDVIRLLQDLGPEGARQTAADSMVAVLREHHSDVRRFFTKMEVASKNGLEAMGAVFEAQSTGQGLISEEEKALTKHMKEKQEDGGGKWKGKRQMPYLVPAPTAMSAAQTAPILQPAGKMWGDGTDVASTGGRMGTALRTELADSTAISTGGRRRQRRRQGGKHEKVPMRQLPAV